VVGTHGYKKYSITTNDLVILVDVGAVKEVGKLYTAIL
jgi:hypothetical protein